MTKRGKSGWFGDHRRHVLAGKGVSTVLPDGRRLPVNNFVAGGGYKVGVKYNVAGFVKEHGGWRWGSAHKDDKGVWYFSRDRSDEVFELSPNQIKVYGVIKDDEER